MKTKIYLLVMLLSFNINAITSYSLYKVYQQTDTLTHANLDSNMLRGSNWSSTLVDTLDEKFVRFTDVDDSSFQKITTDTIRGNPDVDSIQGAPYIDSVTTNRVTTDSSDHRIITADSATIPIEKGVKTFRDSVYIASGLRGLRLYFPQADIDSTVGDINHGGVNYFRGSTGYGQIKMAPAADSGEAMLGFFMDQAGTATTQAWAIGQGGWSNPGDFVIGHNATAWFLIDRAGAASFVGTLTCPTLNTGQGDYELYAMDQNLLTTSDVTFDTVTASLVGIADSAISLRGDTTVDYGDISTITGWSVITANTIEYNRIGKMVFVRYSISGTSNSVQARFTLPFTMLMYNAIGTYSDNGGAWEAGNIDAVGATIYLGTDYNAADGFTASGTKTVKGQFHAFIQ